MRINKSLVFVALFIIIFALCIFQRGRGRTPVSYRDTFLANNWLIPLTEWNQGVITYGNNNYYLAKVKSMKDSVWTLIIAQKDSIVFIYYDQIGGKNVNSVRSLMTDKLWTSHFDSSATYHLYEAARLIFEYNVCNMRVDSSELCFEFFSDGPQVELKKSLFEQNDQWRSLGSGWYERQLSL